MPSRLTQSFALSLPTEPSISCLTLQGYNTAASCFGPCRYDEFRSIGKNKRCDVLLNFMVLSCYITHQIHHCNISMHSMHIAENCSTLLSVYHPFMLCMTIYLANWMETYRRMRAATCRDASN